MNSLMGGSSLPDTIVPFLFLFLPILCVFGATVLSATGSSAFLLLLIVSIAVLFLLTVACESVSSRCYSLAIVTISVSLSLHFVLISPYLVGWDINREYFFFRLVSGSGHWDSTFPDIYNSALSISILPTMLSSVLGVDGVVIFKVLYQLVFSLVPLILYFVYKDQIGARPAFVAMMFMMSYQSYYMELTSVTRQEIAEVILACLVLLLIKRKVLVGDRSLLISLMLLLVGIIISHYSMAYVLISYLVLALILSYMLKMRSRLTVSVVVMSVIASLVWYVYIASGEAFASLARFGSIVSKSMYTEFLNPEARGVTLETAFGMAGPADLMHTVGRGVFYLVQAFILVGVVKILKDRKRSGFSELLVLFSVISMAFLVASVILPFFSGALNMSRIYEIALLFLAPACVLGGKIIFDAVARILSMLSRSWPRKPRVLHGVHIDFAVAVVIVIFLLFNTGFVYEVAMSSPTSISLSYARMKRSDDVAIKAYFYSAYIPAESAVSALWLPGHVANVSVVCGDLVARYIVLCSYAGDYIAPTAESHILYPGSTDTCPYVYLGYLNLVERIGTGPGLFRRTWPISQVSYLLQDRNTIYSNGGSEILVQY